MASIHRRPRSPFYHAAFRGSDGKLVLRSTKLTDRSKAMQAALEFERVAKLATRGDLVESQARAIVSDLMARVDTGETLRTLSIETAFRDWLESRRDRRAESTVTRYETVVGFFLEHLGPKKSKPLTALTSRDVESFVNHRLREGNAGRTVALDAKILRAALNAARRKGLVSTNVSEAVELPESRGIERGTFTAAEVGMLIDTAEGEWKTLILLGYYTGLRLSDCASLTWENVNMTGASLTYTQGKTGTELTIPLHPELLRHLESLATGDRAGERLLPELATLRGSGRSGLSEGFKRIMRKAGLDTGTAEGDGKRKVSKRTFHALRHTFTSMLANAGVAPELRMKLTGHKTEAVHRGYTHHEFESLLQALKRVPSVPHEP